ncbi:MAG: ATP-binding cassette domain-containing protein [Actinoallomurus sp.]
MAQLRAGAFPVVSGVGSPPFVGAFASGTDVARLGYAAVDMLAVQKAYARQHPDLVQQLVCLVGPSGCGKSTLLSILAGFTTADIGEVLVDGRPVDGPGPERGMLFQTPTLFPWPTTRQNVLYGPRAGRALTPECGRRPTLCWRPSGRGPASSPPR